MFHGTGHDSLYSLNNLEHHMTLHVFSIDLPLISMRTEIAVIFLLDNTNCIFLIILCVDINISISVLSLSTSNFNMYMISSCSLIFRNHFTNVVNVLKQENKCQTQSQKNQTSCLINTLPFQNIIKRLD